MGEEVGQGSQGDGLHYQETLAFLRLHDLADEANYAEVTSRIDVEELAAYLAFEVFFDNTDWPGNNIKFWRPRTVDGRWRWMLYDTDFGAGLYGVQPESDSLAAALATDGPIWPNPPWSTELFRLMMKSPEFASLFVETYADLLNTALQPEVTRAALLEVQNEIEVEFPRHVARWGTWTDGVTVHTMPPNAWQEEIWWIDTWLLERPAFAREHLIANLGLAGTWTLDLDVAPPGSGTFLLTAVEVEAPFTGTYFRGVPVTITAVPSAGLAFKGWSDPSLGVVPMVTVDATDRVSLTAEFE